jgi:hypothetical protein
MIRRLIGFVCASSLLAAGLYVLYIQLFVAKLTIHIFHFVPGGGEWAIVGACWLWEDFIGPWRHGPDWTPPRSRIARRWHHDNDNY